MQFRNSTAQHSTLSSRRRLPQRPISLCSCSCSCLSSSTALQSAQNNFYKHSQSLRHVVRPSQRLKRRSFTEMHIEMNTSRLFASGGGGGLGTCERGGPPLRLRLVQFACSLSLSLSHCLTVSLRPARALPQKKTKFRAVWDCWWARSPNVMRSSTGARAILQSAAQFGWNAPNVLCCRLSRLLLAVAFHRAPLVVSDPQAAFISRARRRETAPFPCAIGRPWCGRISWPRSYEHFLTTRTAP